jgi:hypothetical protein
LDSYHFRCYLIVVYLKMWLLIKEDKIYVKLWYSSGLSGVFGRFYPKGATQISSLVTTQAQCPINCIKAHTRLFSITIEQLSNSPNPYNSSIPSTKITILDSQLHSLLDRMESFILWSLLLKRN